MLDFDRLRQHGFQPYRKTTITFAKQMNTPFAVRLISGDEIYGQPGDYACVAPGGEDRWIVNRHIFERTYEAHLLKLDEPAQKRLVRQGFRPYLKHQVTWAKKLDKPKIIHTLEGDVRAQAGDYLCVGTNGEQWPQKPGRFEANYARVTHNRA